MTTLTSQIDVFFETDTTGGDFFTLGDPVKGVLGNSVYRLADVPPTDIADQVYRVTIDRGRNDELAENDAGTLEAVLENSDGRFLPFELNDPVLTDDAGETLTDDSGEALLTDSGVYGVDNILPGKRIRVTVDSHVIYDGQAEDWDYGYPESGEITARMTAVDALGMLARVQFDEWTSAAGQTPGERINSILDRPEVAWPAAKRSIDEGTTTLQADPVSWGSNVLNYMQLVAQSEVAGRLFASREGSLGFRRRVPTGQPAAILTDDGTGIPWFNMALTSSTEQLWNRVSIDRENGLQQTVKDDASIAKYGVRQLTVGGLLFDSDLQSLRLANYLLRRFSEPKVRIRSVQIWLDALPAADRGKVLSLDLGDVVNVGWTPPGTVDSTSTDMFVEGIRHDFGRQEPHIVTLRMSQLPIQLDDLFILGSSQLGGTDQLGY
ncbi:MAG: hypothetical protein AAGA42_11285 [Actinomycetota bacterium]